HSAVSIPASQRRDHANQISTTSAMGPGLLGYLEFHLPGLQIPVVLWPFWPLAASSTLGLTVGARTRGMTRKLHPCARTNAKLRREIQESAEANKALAARLGLNVKTVAKWRSRTTTSDARKGPKRPASTVLSAVEEALIVVFRKHTRLPLNACLAHLKPRIPALSRSALHRCLKRYGVSRIPKDLAKRPTEFELGAEPSDYAIELCAMPGAVSDQFSGPPLAVVTSGYEQPVQIFQQLA